MCGDQGSTFRSWFSPSTVGSGDQSQAIRLVWQSLLPTQPSCQYRNKIYLDRQKTHTNVSFGIVAGCPLTRVHIFKFLETSSNELTCINT